MCMEQRIIDGGESMFPETDFYKTSDFTHVNHENSPEGASAATAVAAGALLLYRKPEFHHGPLFIINIFSLRGVLSGPM